MHCENNINPCSAFLPTATTDYCSGASPFLEVLAFEITRIYWKTKKEQQQNNNMFCLFDSVVTNKQVGVRTSI